MQFYPIPSDRRHCDKTYESGRLEFEEFVTLAAKFIVEEDDEAMQKRTERSLQMLSVRARNSRVRVNY
ncbi:hypothetical protein NQ318_016656 [Aromia moschata]|uniref:Uncharacterized protein n=1 Tax=Aromia moschata TaxID=1265417 RepID=A0AAV8X2J6_9CUCU|nr:hypothetical protein NQ318_016656 [Aromia moschata]